MGITANSVEKPRLEGLAQKVDNTEIVLGKEWHGVLGNSYFAHPLFGMDLRTENQLELNLQGGPAAGGPLLAVGMYETNIVNRAGQVVSVFN